MDVKDLIGKPFAFGGRGPEAYDCYGLVVEMFRRIGVELPQQVSPCVGGDIRDLMKEQLERPVWHEVDEAPGTMALVRLPGTTHVGFVLPHGKMIHASEDSGVMIDRLDALRGRIVAYYEYRG